MPLLSSWDPYSQFYYWYQLSDWHPLPYGNKDDHEYFDQQSSRRSLWSSCWIYDQKGEESIVKWRKMVGISSWSSLLAIYVKGLFELLQVSGILDVPQATGNFHIQFSDQIFLLPVYFFESLSVPFLYKVIPFYT